jgi:hypothetical protein
VAACVRLHAGRGRAAPDRTQCVRADRRQAGQFSYLEQGTAPTDSGTIVFTANAEAHNALGGFAWVHTPIEGVRFGGGLMHYAVQGGALETLLGPSDAMNYYASAEAVFSRFQIRSE